MTQFPLISCPDYLTDRREFLELAATQRTKGGLPRPQAAAARRRPLTPRDTATCGGTGPGALRSGLRRR